MFIDIFKQARIANQNYGLQVKTLQSQGENQRKRKKSHEEIEKLADQDARQPHKAVFDIFFNIFSLEMLITHMVELK